MTNKSEMPASAPVPERKPENDEIGWLIEFELEQTIDGVTLPTWFAGLKREQYGRHSLHERPSRYYVPIPTHDHLVAVRFSRKQDAETILAAVESPYRGLLKVAENMWTDAGRTASPAPAVSGLERAAQVALDFTKEATREGEVYAAAEIAKRIRALPAVPSEDTEGAK